MILYLIIVCEIGFWVLILAGLMIRYIWRRKKLGLVLLALTPVVDLILLIATVIDLRSGTTPTAAHALAAVYIGVSVAFGKSMVAWADRRFAKKYGQAPSTPDPPKYGEMHAKHERITWLRHLLAYAISTVILILMILFIGKPEETKVLLGTIQLWGIIVLIDFVISFSYTLWPRKEKKGAENNA